MVLWLFPDQAGPLVQKLDCHIHHLSESESPVTIFVATLGSSHFCLLGPWGTGPSALSMPSALSA